VENIPSTILLDAMTITELGAIGELLAAIAVLATLVYLSIQVRQGNLHARAQARQRMVEQAQSELNALMNDEQITELFTKRETLSPHEQAKLNYFLAESMRQREWEWFQFQDGTIDQPVYEAYHEVIAIQLGTTRTRQWWNSIGKTAFNEDFVASVDSLLETTELSTYFQDIRQWDK